ncbi:MAG: hypothetical protein ACLQME_01630 [Alphaproteobacteria bacterium]
MNVYELYKPLRNYLRQVCLLDSLAVIHAYLQNLQFGRPFPNGIEVHPSYTLVNKKIGKRIYEWELELLAKEVILNSPDLATCPKSFSHWAQFAGAINRLKKLDHDIADLYSELHEKNILLELHRVAHRQFPWQSLPKSSTLTRYFRIFSHPVLDRILQERVGVTTRQLYTLGLALTGHYANEFTMDYPAPVTIPGLDGEHAQRFLSRFARDISILRSEISASQAYDENYLYAFNPLKTRPLILAHWRGRQVLIAPIPTYLFQRFTEGVYYEICGDHEFAAAFGESFQTYVGDVLRAVKGDSHLFVAPEAEYLVRKDRKDSVDWIIADHEAALFVECKTKRLQYASKIALSDVESLNEDLAKMAAFIVQAYRTQADCMRGHYPHWKPGSLQIFPVIVTLQDWYIFGPKLVPELDRRVAEGLKKGNVDPSIMRTSPYTICAVSGFERAVQVMKEVGIQRFMGKKTAGEERLWALEPFITGNFRDESRLTKVELFPDDYAKIHPLLN